MRIQLVFANYHCAADIARCITGLATLKPEAAIDVCIVENAGPAVELSALPQGPHLTLNALTPKTNLGYFGALRYAIALSEPSAPYSWRALCNPDIEFRDVAAFLVLGAMASADRVGVVAPSMVSSISGRDQNPYLRSRPGPATRARWRTIYSAYVFYVLNEWRSKTVPVSGTSLVASKVTDTPGQEDIYAPHGSLMFFSEAFLTEQKEALEAIPFLYCEELFVGEICNDSNWRIVYAPEIVVDHREHATTALIPPRRRFELQRAAMRAYLNFLGRKAS